MEKQNNNEERMEEICSFSIISSWKLGARFDNRTRHRREYE